MPTLTLRIEKMSCGACVRRVAQTLNRIPGTHAEEVQVGAARVRSESPEADILNALGEAGFPAQVEHTGA